MPGTPALPYGRLHSPTRGSHTRARRQQALFNVLKAYSVLDKELGYCQSMSFIVAILLLYMPEHVRYRSSRR